MHWMVGRGWPQAAGGQYHTSNVYTGGQDWVQTGLEKWFDGSLLILEWVKVQMLQLGRKEKPHFKMGK